MTGVHHSVGDAALCELVTHPEAKLPLKLLLDHLCSGDEGSVSQLTPRGVKMEGEDGLVLLLPYK